MNEDAIKREAMLRASHDEVGLCECGVAAAATDGHSADGGNLIERYFPEPGARAIVEWGQRHTKRLIDEAVAAEHERAVAACARMLVEARNKIRRERRAAPWPEFGAYGDPATACRNGFNMAIDRVLEILADAE